MIQHRNTSKARQQALTNALGFSLIEPMLLILFISLVTHGVYRSTHLLSNAKVEFLIDKISEVNTAWLNFQNKFNAIPGDYSFASVYIDSRLIDGNGNGKIDTDLERAQAWAHLKASGKLRGAHLFNVTPSNSWGSTMALSYGTVGINFSKPDNELLLGMGIPVTTLAGLDQRLDDGNAQSGQIQLSKSVPGFSKQAQNACLYESPVKIIDINARCAGVIRLMLNES